ncbi:Neuronal acetylcholine receptor subunit alpha-7 [Sparganum proliferum]
MITSIIWIDMNWEDYHFRWNPASFGNITSLNLPYNTVWRPDVLLYNCADEKFDRLYPTNVVIRHTGMMQWLPPGLFKSTCNMNILWFPFDEQTCILKFGSWTYFGDQVNLIVRCADGTSENCSNSAPVDLSEYLSNGEFQLIRAVVRRYAQRYECCDYDFIDIKMEIVIRRRALYYVFNLIVPCILISGMALLVFTLPPDAGEKISLGVTILLSLTMFLQLVADKLPQTSEAIPLIGIYFSCTMILCSLSIVFTVLVLSYHHRSICTEEVPPWLKLVVNRWLAKLVRLEMSQGSSDGPETETYSTSSKSDNEQFLWQDPDSVSRDYQETLSKTLSGIILPVAAANDGLPGQISPHANARSTVPAQNGRRFVGCVAPAQKQRHLGKQRGVNVLDLEENFRVTALSPLHKPFGQQETVHSAPKETQWRRKVHGENSNADDVTYARPRFDGVSSRSESEASCCKDCQAEDTQHHTDVYRSHLRSILHELRAITRKMRADEAEDAVRKEWKFTARVIDRFCLIIFSIVNLISTFCIFFSAPQIIESFRA